MGTETTGPRERYRAQVRAEIKQRAWEQLATNGVAALSLKAIAEQLGMSGPALYRYFASRDELITTLIRDAYRSLADALRAAADAGADIAGLARAVRAWALDEPQRYLLIYGTPVPGYHAPEDTTAISGEIMATVLDGYRRRDVPPSGLRFETHLDAHRGWAADPTLPAATLRQALAFWTRVHGVLSLELAGHFAGMGFDPGLLFDDEIDDLLRR
ncbi:TetR/AcrR family transcriptional regulator [Micromonospora sp. WMMD714]|uniref:TetR/AcrR family transcriptional regulator n=1 Tax=Micromonospora sp. WMMD714 TaxID=3016097 RepID=UPI00249BDBC6|nr:TetR/AcrR family transcriptional regulator [Micromonospora sp. WMMD714]WFE63574.1 TetR/AcrR family transcriptional regulator [Micromonospora sp. WMMD714]